jgi:hypothetical protein
MFFSLVPKANDISIIQFIQAIKDGERDFLKILNTKPSEFEVASFDLLMSNTDDILAGVNKVEMNFQNRYFDLFNNTLIKHHDNGDIKFVFYTETKDAAAIIKFTEAFFSLLGIGLYDNRNFFPFTNQQRIWEIASGGAISDHKDTVHSWWLDGIHFLLQYRIEPLRQFSLMVTKSLSKKKDNSIRRKGTIMKELHFDIRKILFQDPLHFLETIEGANSNLSIIRIC